MFRTIVLLSVTVLASVDCDLQDFVDRDAFLLAQQWNNSLLEPPKELYNRIVSELAAVRKAYPEVSAIQHNPTFVPGKLVCYNIDYQKLNDSKEFGEIRVEGIGSKVHGYDQVVVTFTKPFNSMSLQPSLITRYGKSNNESENYWDCNSVSHWGAQSLIQRSHFGGSPDPILYDFVIVRCFAPQVFDCPDAKRWSFEIETDAKTGHISVKRRAIGNNHESSTVEHN